MERWAMENSTQSPWNNIGSVATGDELMHERTEDVMDGTGTDDGSWWPCEAAGSSGGA